MGNDRQKSSLFDYIMRLPEGERETVLSALHEAERTPPSPKELDEVEARYGSPGGDVDVQRYITDLFQNERPEREVDRLLLAVHALHLRLGFKEVQTDDGPRYVRFDKIN